jgi:SAM-dependent methyltransferase
MGERSGWAALVGTALSSAAVLMLEVVLTRVFAVAQFHHFAFVAVSLALLGFGAAGSFLYVWPRLGRGGPGRWATLAALQSAAIVGGYLVVNRVPFDSFTVAWDRRQILYLAVVYLALATPFFFAGALVTVLLAGWDQTRRVPAHRVYAASLAGAGLGAPMALAAIDHLGGEGAVVATAGTAALAVPLLLAAGSSRRQALPAVALLMVVTAGLLGAGPESMELRLSPYKELSAALRYPEASLLATGWTPASRVDHVASEGIRSLPGLSLAYPGIPPEQQGITVDGDDLSPIPLVEPEQADFASYLLYALPYQLKPGAETVVLNAGGGLGVLTALASGAAEVTAVVLDPLVAEAAAASPAYRDPRVEVVVEDPRVFAEKADGSFDIVHLALGAPFRPVTSGAYSLAEDYSLTLEGMSAYLDALRPGGVLVVVRWLQTPPSEGIRAVALTGEAIRRRGGDPASSVVALRGFSNLLVLASPDGFRAGQLARTRDFAERLRFDLVAFPGLYAGEANRFNRLPEDGYFPLASSVLTESAPTDLYRSYPFDISPPTDDHPFFHHYFTFQQTDEVLAVLGRTWQPFGGAGYFVLVALLLLSILAAGLLILGPLTTKARRGPGLGWTMGYFGLLGLAFLLVEIPIFQRYILVLGRPTTALAVVLASVLAASGLGSQFSNRFPWLRTAIVLTVVATLQPWLVAGVIEFSLSAPFWLRAVLVAGSVLPVGFLMGTMFPKGIDYLETTAPQLVPWAWGINGAASVVAAIGAALAALSWGFTVVMLAGAACYGGATLLALAKTRDSPVEGVTGGPTPQLLTR